jgi:hypothetical protein
MPTPRPRPDPGPQPPSSSIPEAQPAPQPTPPAPAPAADSPPPSAEPEPPPVDVDRVRAQVAEAVVRAYAALRARDYPAANKALADVADTALDDQQATERLQRWRQLMVYAEAYPEYRDKALASAAKTTTDYESGNRKIGIVEVTQRELIYRDSRKGGRNHRVPLTEIPPDVERVIVAAWFAKGGQAANHLYLGAAALTRREPNLGLARRDWEKAAADGEADGTLLLELLDDPVVRGE